MRINELQSSTTQSVELIKLILRERRCNNDESQTGNVWSSKREINFLLTKMIGHPPCYEEVTTNDDTIDATTLTQCTAPPCYTDEEQETDTNPYPPSYESVLSER